MKNILSLKHWQVFIIVSVLPIMILAGIFVCQRDVANMDGVEVNVLSYSIILNTIACFWWYYFVGINLFKLRPKELNMSLFVFRICCLVSFCLGILIPFLLLSFKSMPFDLKDIQLAIVVFLFLVLLISTFYCGIFIARELKSLERRTIPKFDDYLLETILILILPFGIWIIQPRINYLSERFKSQTS